MRVLAIDPGTTESEPVCIEVAGKPLGQPRQRHTIVAGHVRNYTPADHPVNVFKMALRAAWPSGKRFDGPVQVTITAIFPRPKSKTTKRGPNNRYRSTGKPDWDNIAKAVCDGLNGVAWKDDSQVADGRVERWVAAADEDARTIVSVQELA